MGLFSRKKKIFVSSTAYNMAGDINERPQYLPTAILGGILVSDNFSASDTIQSSLLNGPGIRLRSFARWSRTSGYLDLLEQSNGGVFNSSDLDPIAIAAEIPVDPGQTVNIQSLQIGLADFTYWADRWMLENHPDEVTGDYTVDFDDDANLIIIEFAGGGPTYSFTPEGFNNISRYLYVDYIIADESTYGPLVPGSTEYVDTAGELPSITGWNETNTVVTPLPITYTTTVDVLITYSDGRPDETSHSETDTVTTYDKVEKTYVKKVYGDGDGSGGDGLTAVTSTMYQWNIGYPKPTVVIVENDETIGGGVIKHTQTTTTTEALGNTYAYKIDTQESVEKKWSPMQILIYEENTGNPVFDEMFSSAGDLGTFFPAIPMRLDNGFVGPDYYPDIYEASKKAMKKATGGKYDDIQDSIADNESIDDIDYVYTEFGVSLNTKEDRAKKYIYKFFQMMVDNGLGQLAEYQAWQGRWATANDTVTNWQIWRQAQNDPNDPLYGLPEPTFTSYPPMPEISVDIASPKLNYRKSLVWSAIVETISPGLGREGAKKGDIWFSVGDTEEYHQIIYSNGLTDIAPNPVDFLTLRWQDEVNSFRTIGVWGMKHINVVYKGKAVTIYPAEAMIDPEESGFIVPLHEELYRAMNLVDTTQMATACSYLIFNSYKEVKEKWYATSAFKIVLVIVVIVITVISAGTGAGSAGVLGPAGAVGAALGFAGTVAIIVGTIANAIAAMLISNILLAASTKIFGEEIGLIVGTIASIIAINAGTAINAGSSAASVGASNSAAFSMPNLATPQNLMRLGVAAGKGYAQYIEAGNRDIMAEIQETSKAYEERSKEIQSLYEQNIGYSSSLFDPLSLIGASESANFIPEGASTFLSRTLMTGTDVAQTSISMLTNFSEITLSTQLQP